MESGWKLWHRSRLKDPDGTVCLSKFAGFPGAITTNYHYSKVAVILTKFSVNAAILLGCGCIMDQNYYLIRTVTTAIGTNKCMRSTHENSTCAKNMKFHGEINYSGLWKTICFAECQQDGFASIILVKVVFCFGQWAQDETLKLRKF